MTANEYQAKALRTMADQGAIAIRRMVLDQCSKVTQLENGLRGLTDEVGEIAAAVKKYVEYGQPLDTNNIKEEVGDCLWRLAQIADACGFTLEDAMKGNITKLMVRYPNKYSDAAAHDDNRDRRLEAAAVASVKVDGTDGINYEHDAQGPIPFRPKKV